jgi:hypothetical protein
VGTRVGGVRTVRDIIKHFVSLRDIIKHFVSSDAKPLDNSGSTVTNAYDSVSALSTHRCESNGLRPYIVECYSDGESDRVGT